MVSKKLKVAINHQKLGVRQESPFEPTNSGLWSYGKKVTIDRSPPGPWYFVVPGNQYCSTQILSWFVCYGMEVKPLLPTCLTSTHSPPPPLLFPLPLSSFSLELCCKRDFRWRENTSIFKQNLEEIFPI